MLIHRGDERFRSVDLVCDLFAILSVIFLPLRSFSFDIYRVLFYFFLFL